MENLEELPVKATETNKDPILKQVKQFTLKGWPAQVTQKAFYNLMHIIKMNSQFKMVVSFMASE